MAIKVRVLRGRKLLVGSLGVAAASFIGPGCHSFVANLMAAPSCDVAPKDPNCYRLPDAATDAGLDVRNDAHDALTDGASDATDAAIDTAPDAEDAASDALADATDGTTD